MLAIAALALFVPLSVEGIMQNSGLAKSLAGTAFPDLEMATVPDAILSVWHNIYNKCNGKTEAE